MVLTLAAMSSLLQLMGRTEDATAVGAASAKATAETGLHIANLWSGPALPVPDLDSTDPVMRAAVERGRSWSREEALDRAIELADQVAGGSLTAAPAPPTA
jgi:hypothetical protein